MGRPKSERLSKYSCGARVETSNHRSSELGRMRSSSVGAVSNGSIQYVLNSRIAQVEVVCLRDLAAHTDKPRRESRHRNRFE